jgi:energy-coupling factor transporter ATP-binding protein EcfA2
MLRELSVHNYKNLEAIRVSISDRTVLYGRNGAGKSNLLEALALTAGDPITTGQVARRAVSPAGCGISAVITASSSLMAELVKGGASEAANSMFWSTLGVDALPESWASGIERSWLPSEIKDAIVDPSSIAIRYSLSSVRQLEELAAYDRGGAYRRAHIDFDRVEEEEDERPSVSRQFDRTLCVSRKTGESLRRLAITLPDTARPLLVDSLDEGDWAEVLTLPPGEGIPLEVVWLARERSDDELWRDYVESIESAAAIVKMLTDAACRVLDLLRWPDEIADNSLFIAKSWFADHAQASIATLLPHVRLHADNDWLTVEIETANDLFLIGHPGDVSWFSRLSSGERSLVDEALLDAMRALHADALDTLATYAVLETEPNLLLDLQVEMESTLEVPESGHWSRADVDRLIGWGKRQYEARYGRPLRPEVSIVRIFDEPERHLHPSARAALASTLHDHVTGGAVIVSTHASEFLAREGWDHLHLFRTREGVVIDRFDPADLDRAHAVARDMGMSAGDLLSRIRYLLLVEGVHDEAFLDGYCGDLLRSLGILVLPMHGADEVLQAAQTHLFVRYLDAGIGTLLDHSRTRSGSASKSKEARLLLELAKEARRRGVMVDSHRLVRPDIIAYIDDDEIRRDAPDFPGFRAVEKRWREPPRNSDFKTIASEYAGGLQFTRTTIHDLARRTAARTGRPPQDLSQMISGLAEASRRVLTVHLEV